MSQISVKRKKELNRQFLNHGKKGPGVGPKTAPWRINAKKKKDCKSLDELTIVLEVKGDFFEVPLTEAINDYDALDNSGNQRPFVMADFFHENGELKPIVNVGMFDFVKEKVKQAASAVKKAGKKAKDGAKRVGKAVSAGVNAGMDSLNSGQEQDEAHEIIY